MGGKFDKNCQHHTDEDDDHGDEDNNNISLLVHIDWWCTTVCQ